MRLLRCGLLACSLLAAGGAWADTGPCKSDSFSGLTCGEGAGAARVIDGTISPSKKLAFAWRTPGKPPTEMPDGNVESLLIRLYDGAALAIAPGEFWDTGQGQANRYEQHAAWSPDSRYVVEILDFRWQTLALRLHAVGKADRIATLDLKAVLEPAVRKYMRRTVKDERDYYFAIFGSADSETPHISVDDRGTVKAAVQMVVPRPEYRDIKFDVALPIVARNGILKAGTVIIHRARE